MSIRRRYEILLPLQFNDGFLFRAADNVKAKVAQFKAVESYGELMGLVKAAMG